MNALLESILQQARNDFNRPPSERLPLIQELAERAISQEAQTVPVTLNQRQSDIVFAALRFYQSHLTGEAAPDELVQVEVIATNSFPEAPTLEEIEAIIEGVFVP